MRKSDKKIENHIRNALNSACDEVLKTVTGFKWLTHQVNYADFTNSFKIICVFDSNDELKQYLASKQKDAISNLLEGALKDINIKTKTISKVIYYDSEENCLNEQNGNWARRLKNI